MTVPAGSVLSRWAALDDLLAALTTGAPCLRADGLWGSSRALVAAALRDAHRPSDPPDHAGTVPASPDGAGRRLLRRLALGRPRRGRRRRPEHARVLEFPSGTGTSWRGTRHREPDAERALCCRRLLDGDAVVIVATPSGLSESVPPPAAFTRRTFTLTVGESSDREILLELLQGAGYERVETVMEVGQWSVRGGIVDIFSPTHERPVRAEFVGDEVESLRVFDPTHPALDRAAPRADRAAPGLEGRGAGHPGGLPAARDAGGAGGSRDAGGAAGRRALRGAARLGAGALPAPRAPAAPAQRGRDLDGHARRGRLPRPVQGAGGRDPHVAGRGLHGAPGGGRRAAERPAAPDAGRARSRAVAGGHALEPGRARGASWASARRASRSPRSASSCSARRRSSARSAAGSGARSSSAARPSRRSTTWPPTTWWCTSSTASAATTACARSPPRGTTPTSCCWSTPTAAGSTCRSSGST